MWGHTSVNARYISSPRRCSCTTTGSLIRCFSRRARAPPAHLHAIDGVDHVTGSKPRLRESMAPTTVDATTTPVGTHRWQHLTDFIGEVQPKMPRRISVLIPTIRPRRLTSGPPLLPELIAFDPRRRLRQRSCRAGAKRQCQSTATTWLDLEGARFDRARERF